MIRRINEMFSLTTILIQISGMWIFNKNGVNWLVSDPNISIMHGSVTSLGSRRKVLVFLPCNQVISSHEELEQRLFELGWKRYNDGGNLDLIQFHRSEASPYLISLPRNYSNLKLFHMYDVVVKNTSYFEVRDLFK
ncbi:hypothetical protein FEM48_Zijuj03G0066300 [Ziziphus jujuba var. spinosa]|uniref:Flowering-promoting factor 1-like protein 2 n=1 Tax=Ziziphus jujuba var. spinosa TaxID=714518 RepID=A0A978VNR8_ZIZJJ|nr:hypothetical protein FEM48_Zijuj03G0066300 [Ziziphus jujuba var. spinosa]